MTRTEQFLEGYDSCRRRLQILIADHEELGGVPELLELAMHSYYKEDGVDWHPDCAGCMNWMYNGLDHYFYCSKNVSIVKIKGGCEKRKDE